MSKRRSTPVSDTSSTLEKSIGSTSPSLLHVVHPQIFVITIREKVSLNGDLKFSKNQ